MARGLDACLPGKCGGLPEVDAVSAPPDADGEAKDPAGIGVLVVRSAGIVGGLIVGRDEDGVAGNAVLLARTVSPGGDKNIALVGTGDIAEIQCH